MKKFNFKKFIKFSDRSETEASWLVSSLITEQAVDSGEEFSCDNDESLFGSFPLTDFSIINRLHFPVMLERSDSSHVEGFSKVFGSPGRDSRSAEFFSTRFSDLWKEPEVSDEMISGLEPRDVSDFRDEDSSCFGSDAWNRSDEIELGWALAGRIEILGDDFVEVFDGCFKIHNLFNERSNDSSSSLLCFSGVDGFFGDFNKFFGFLPVEVIALERASDFFQGSGVNSGNVFCSGIASEYFTCDFSEGIFENLQEFWKDDLQKRMCLPLIILEIGNETVTCSDQVSESLDQIIGNIAGSSFAGAKKSCDTEGVDVIGFCLFRKQFPITVGLKGVEQNHFDVLPFQESKEIFPEMSGGFQAGYQSRSVDLSFLKNRPQLFKTFGRGIDREAGSCFFPFGIQESATVGLQTHVDTQIVHKVPFFVGCSTHGDSPLPEIRIAWSILSGDEDESPHSILNKCSRPQEKEATVLIEGSKRSQGDKQVVSPSEEDTLLEKQHFYLAYKQPSHSRPYLGYPLNMEE